MPAQSIYPFVGQQQIALFGLPDTTSRCQTGLTLQAEDNYWGPLEVVYVYAPSAIRQGGLVKLTPTFPTNKWRYDAIEVDNTANLGRPLYVAMAAFGAGTYGWVANMGIVPVNCTSSIAADTTFGIVGTGQGGTNSAGKQVLNARVIAPATTTVVKNNCFANVGSVRLQVPSTDGLFAGVYMSGTGIQAATTIVDIDPSGNFVTLSLPTTAAVGTVTATYNNATVFYNVVHIDRPMAQGAIT